MRTIRTPQKRGKFLAALRRHGNATLAAKSIGIGHRTVYEWRADELEFKAEWEDALIEYSTILEAEADRRAVEGLTNPVYYKGAIVGHIQEYSDILLMFRLKKLNTAYKDRMEHSGNPDSPVVVLQLESRLNEGIQRRNEARNGHARTVTNTH